MNPEPDSLYSADPSDYSADSPRMDSSIVDIVFGIESDGLPTVIQISRWSAAALDNTRGRYALRIVGLAEMTELNNTWRNKREPTNVLSFPVDLPVALQSEIDLIGDVAICAAVVEQEASEQHKSSHAHWAHMIVHGVLHLRGFDHVTEPQAAIMESEEVRILEALGFPNPYHVEDRQTEQGIDRTHE